MKLLNPWPVAKHDGVFMSDQTFWCRYRQIQKYRVQQPFQKCQYKKFERREIFQPRTKNSSVSDERELRIVDKLIVTVHRGTWL